MQWISTLPPLFEAFLATVLLGFVLGLEVHSYRRANEQDLGIGTTRTMTLIAIIGFMLADLDAHLILFGIGFAVLGGLLGLQYWKALTLGKQSLMPTLIALLTYLLGPIALMHNLWLLVLYTVAILLLLGEKPGIRRLSDQVRTNELVTLAKFMIMAGLILPLLPDQPIAPGLNVSWNQLWLAVVAVSGISYISYLVQTYFLPRSGLLLSGLLGGLYSSTATTVVLSRRAQQDTMASQRSYATAVVLASSMMYGRLLVLILLLGHTVIAGRLWLSFALAIASAALAAWMLRTTARDANTTTPPETPPVRHPLEFSTAVVFAGLFVLFAIITEVVVGRFGSHGLHWLAFLVGFTDIDPFILALLAGHYGLDPQIIAHSILIATASNNLLKAIYAVLITRKAKMLQAAAALLVVSAVSLGYAYLT